MSVIKNGVPDKFYAHGQAIGSTSITLNLTPFLMRIQARDNELSTYNDDITLSMKSITLVATSAGGTNVPIAVVGDVVIPSDYIVRNESSTVATPAVILHSVGFAGVSGSTASSYSRTSVHHEDGGDYTKLIVPRANLINANGQLVVSFANQLVYGDASPSVSIAHFEIIVEASAVNGNSTKTE
jgi:hypothetical protein